MITHFGGFVGRHPCDAPKIETATRDRRDRQERVDRRAQAGDARSDDGTDALGECDRLGPLDVVVGAR
jgi:hypothetical protein